ncbi:MAG: hypothetical protein M3Y42_09665 [Actinomycetota bacterium]|nr:hypothetical protein [Actinomycetota bacterium]MDQ2957218.1 hypothetical protein [Actinomycetota bacterium]
MSALSELLNAANTERLSARELARRAREQDFTLNHDTAARYLRGDHGRPDEDTLMALAKVLEVPLAKLRTAAELPSEVTEPYRPPPESSRLNRRQRRAVDEIIRAMLEPQPATRPVTALKPGLKPGRKSADDEDLAARRGDAEPPQN